MSRRYVCSYPNCPNRSDTNRIVKKCNGCRTYTYCGRQCQLNHWKVHKPVCKLIKEHYAPPLSKKRHHKIYLTVPVRELLCTVVQIPDEHRKTMVKYVDPSEGIFDIFTKDDEPDQFSYLRRRAFDYCDAVDHVLPCERMFAICANKGTRHLITLTKTCCYLKCEHHSQEWVDRLSRCV
jgi:hypothetical protein